MTYCKLENKVRYTLTYLLFFHEDLLEVTVAYFITIDIQLKLG